MRAASSDAAFFLVFFLSKHFFRQHILLWLLININLIHDNNTFGNLHN